MNEWMREKYSIAISFTFKVGPYSTFLLQGSIKKPPKIYVSTGYFQFQNLQKMYTLSHFLHFNLNWYLAIFLLKELSQDNLKVY